MSDSGEPDALAIAEAKPLPPPSIDILRIAEIAKLRAENAGLREALEPFAKEAELFRHPGWKETDLCDGTDRLTIGDLRKARAALSSEPQADGSCEDK